MHSTTYFIYQTYIFAFQSECLTAILLKYRSQLWYLMVFLPLSHACSMGFFFSCRSLLLQTCFCPSEPVRNTLNLFMFTIPLLKFGSSQKLPWGAQDKTMYQKRCISHRKPLCLRKNITLAIIRQSKWFQNTEIFSLQCFLTFFPW